jgi:tetratricopeptide (TPR) repeat protein
MRWIGVLAVWLALTASVRAGDWGARRDAFDPAVVARYEAILAHDPHDEGALRALITLYKAYRSVAKLESEYRAKLGTGEDWATLVVLARLPRPSHAETIDLWKRALAAKPDDARGWLAAGDAQTGDAATARDAYLHAAKLAAAPTARRTALTKLISAARSAGDAVVVDDAYVQLIALSPKDGMLWLERGNAQLAAKQLAAARDSFAAAEPLLATDPERQLAARTNQGIALEALGRTDEAIAQYEHTLDRVPAGYYLGQELIQRIIDAERKRGKIAAAIERLEKRWPERKRAYFEWLTLGDLYHEAHDDTRAIDAYTNAVTIAPTEVATQRKLIALLDTVDSALALRQHEAAARLAPGDADLQLALAKRYWPAQTEKGLAVLDALAHRMSRNVNVRTAIAAMYEQWEQPVRAIGEYEAIAAIEPQDPDHAVVLGEAYWRAEDQTKARAAWQRLEKIGTAAALFRLGEVLSVHELWADATQAYSKSLELDGTSADAWYGRAHAYDEVENFKAALADARRAVALTGTASQEDGMRNRQLLVRVLGHAYTSGDRDVLPSAIETWRFAFEHGDAAAGYLLAAHHARIESYQLHDVLLKLHQLVPTDDSLGIALARSFVHRRDFASARAELEQIARRSPARAEEIGKLIAQVDKDRVRAEEEIRLEEEGRSATATGSGASTDLVGRDQRFGTRLTLGGDVHARSGALLGIGLYRTSRIAEGTAMLMRLDWTKHTDGMDEVDGVALGAGVATRLLDARKLEVAIAVAPVLELRYGAAVGGPRWDRAAIAGDVTLEILPRALPATLGLRFDQCLTEQTRGSALLVELGLEVR